MLFLPKPGKHPGIAQGNTSLGFRRFGKRLWPTGHRSIYQGTIEQKTRREAKICARGSVCLQPSQPQPGRPLESWVDDRSLLAWSAGAQLAASASYPGMFFFLFYLIDMLLLVATAVKESSSFNGGKKLACCLDGPPAWIRLEPTSTADAMVGQDGLAFFASHSVRVTDAQ